MEGPECAATRPGEPAGASGTLLGYIGYLGPQDGVDHLLRSMQDLTARRGRSDFRCLIIGDGEELEPLKALARELGVDGCASFVGRLPWPEAMKLLQTADVCVDPDPSTPFNDVSTMVKMLEYMALGKPIVAYGAHLLAEKGILDLDRPLSAYLESRYVEDRRIDQITARLVLSHSSGFPNWRPGRWSDDPKPLLIEFDPGEKFQYSGEGYQYLQEVIEHLTGETLDRYLERAVLEPLGMTDSSFLWEERFEGNHASRHDGEGVPGREWQPREALAAGTLQTTAGD